MSLDVNRRRLLLGGAVLGGLPVGAAATAEVLHGSVPFVDGASFPQAAQGGSNYLYFSTAEAQLIEAVCARMIPNDSLGPGAVEVGVPRYIDRQLAGEFGHGARWYMQGPWDKGQPTQGYQSRMTPAAMYRAAAKAIDEATNKDHSKPFAQLSGDDQDAFLKKLEKGDVQLSGGVDAKAFFDMLLQNVLEGYWADPIYGGNKDMAGWKLIGFPGARYDNTPYVAYRGQAYPLPPVGLKGRPEWTRR